MLTVMKRRYKKQYAIGGSGIFSSNVGFFKKLFTSDAAKKVATSIASSAAKQAGKHLTNKLLEAPPASANVATTPAITQTSIETISQE